MSYLLLFVVAGCATGSVHPRHPSLGTKFIASASFFLTKKMTADYENVKGCPVASIHRDAERVASRKLRGPNGMKKGPR